MYMYRHVHVYSTHLCWTCVEREEDTATLSHDSSLIKGERRERGRERERERERGRERERERRERERERERGREMITKYYCRQYFVHGDEW